MWYKAPTQKAFLKEKASQIASYLVKKAICLNILSYFNQSSPQV
jgi:hypothetical protein